MKPFAGWMLPAGGKLPPPVVDTMMNQILTRQNVFQVLLSIQIQSHLESHNIIFWPNNQMTTVTNEIYLEVLNKWDFEMRSH